MKKVFWTAALLRFLCALPFVIDDDEAWWSASALALKTPWEFYRKAIDNKPPGTVWFYWCLEHLVPHGADPRIARAAFAAATIAAALVLGWIAKRLSGRRDSGWIAATLFLLVTAAPSPKLLALTGDGLVSLLVIATYALVFFSEFSGAAFLGGICFGGALLVKQTAAFFVFPVLAAHFTAKPASFRRLSRFFLGTSLFLLPAIWALGPRPFIYWNWTYPREVLIPARAQLAFSYSDLFSNLTTFALATLPILFALRKLRLSILDLRVLWLLAGVWGVLVGKGAFLHYFLLIAPPLALLGAEAIAELRIGTLLWLGIPYALGALALALPLTGIFWGTDLLYFGALQKVLNRTLAPGESIVVWGGSAVPLASSRAPYIAPFLLPRFITPPYGTRANQAIFEHELVAHPPDLILDLHERGDNRFDLPLESEPALAALARSYRLYVSPELPWAKFYFRDLKKREALVEVRDRKAAYATFPSEKRSWEALESTEALRDVFIAEWKRRALAALELIALQGRESDRGRASMLHERLAHEDPWDVREEITRFFDSMSEPPLPIRSPAWWPEVALVELQPRQSSR